MTVIDHISRSQLRQHLDSLDPESLRLRFGYLVNKEVLDRYVEDIKDRDILLGIHRQGQCVSTLHLAIDPAANTAELAVSTVTEYRRQGLAEALIRHAVDLIRNRNISTVYTVCNAANQPLLKLFGKLGIATVASDTGEREIRLTIPQAGPDSVYSELKNLQMLIIDKSLGSMTDFWQKCLGPKSQ
jgi:GNAT superfamily N-acetyltransferase